MKSHSYKQILLNLLIVAVLLASVGMTASASGFSLQSWGRRVPNQGGGTDGPDAPRTPDSPFPERNFSQGKPDVLKTAGSKTNTLAALGDTVIFASVQIDKPSLAQVGKTMTGAQRVAYAAEVSAYQDKLAADIEAVGGNVIYRFHTLSSGLIVEMPAKVAGKVAAVPGVTHISRIYDYQKDLSETVPFIGADALKSIGYTGEGVKVAVLDSGIDYTHAAFGGPGTVQTWEDAYWGADPDCIAALGRIDGCANSQAPAVGANFGATSKVKGGYDWVGPIWPFGPLMPDSNPIANRQDSASGDDGAHGTHVADIIAGEAFNDGVKMIGEGVAPGADLYAFTVCSQVSTACAGVAMLQGLDSAADLDNDPFTYDPADVVNMSLGSDFGQPEDDATYYTNQLVSYGTIVVASAGNGGDLPFVLGSPSAADGAISVAQTTVPSDKQYVVTIDTDPVTIAYKPALQPWSVAPAGVVTGEVAYDTTSTDTQLGCTNADGDSPWSNPSLFTDKVLLVDRGVCSASMKANNGFAAGAKMVLVAMVNGIDPYTFSYGGGVVTGPVFTITLADGNLIKANLVNNITVTVDPADSLSLAYGIVSSSSRGLRNHDNVLKPDIGAPGASVSAIAGSGNQADAFGGTSGAAPMVSGAAALMKQVYGDSLIPQQYKALLMNSANNRIFQDVTPQTPEGTLAPVSRIGAGQVDLEKAINTRLLAWDVTESDPLTWTGSMSFMYQPVSAPTDVTRTLRIKNMYYNERTVYLQPEFRYANDMGMGVTITPAVDSITIPAGETVDVDVTITLDPADLRQWFNNVGWYFNIDRGYYGGDGYTFTDFEVDGYLHISACTGDPSLGTSSCVSSISVPWEVLPKPVGDSTATADLSQAKLTFTNASPSVDNNVDLFALVAQSPNDYHAVVGDCASLGMLPGCNTTLPDLKEVGVRDAFSGYVEFAMTLWNEPFFASEFPVEIDIYVDSNQDGNDDYVVYNYDEGGSTPNGFNVVKVFRFATGITTIVTYTDSTFDSNNYDFWVPMSTLGLTAGQSFNFSVYAADVYFTGNYTDCAPYDEVNGCTYATYTLGSARYMPDSWLATVPAADSLDVTFVTDNTADTTQNGLLALYREAGVGVESYAVRLDGSDPSAPFKFFLPLINK